VSIIVYLFLFDALRTNGSRTIWSTTQVAPYLPSVQRQQRSDVLLFLLHDVRLHRRHTWRLLSTLLTRECHVVSQSIPSAARLLSTDRFNGQRSLTISIFASSSCCIERKPSLHQCSPTYPTTPPSLTVPSCLFIAAQLSYGSIPHSRLACVLALSA
jgi:hypothetical protein